MEYLEYIPAALLTISGFPQIFKLLRQKESDHISEVTYLLTWLAVAMLTGKSYFLGDTMLLAGNAVSMVTLTVNLILIFRYRK